MATAVRHPASMASPLPILLLRAFCACIALPPPYRRSALTHHVSACVVCLEASPPHRRRRRWPSPRTRTEGSCVREKNCELRPRPPQIAQAVTARTLCCGDTMEQISQAKHGQRLRERRHWRQHRRGGCGRSPIVARPLALRGGFLEMAGALPLLVAHVCGAESWSLSLSDCGVGNGSCCAPFSRLSAELVHFRVRCPLGAIVPLLDYAAVAFCFLRSTSCCSSLPSPSTGHGFIHGCSAHLPCRGSSFDRRRYRSRPSQTPCSELLTVMFHVDAVWAATCFHRLPFAGSEMFRQNEFLYPLSECCHSVYNRQSRINKIILPLVANSRHSHRILLAFQYLLGLFV